MNPKLYYYDFNGLAEAIRYILYYSGQKFEDIRYERKNWFSEDTKKAKFPYGQMPLYEEDNRSLNQSLAIARYVASKTDLLPFDLWDQAVLDAFVLNVYDFMYKMKNWMVEQDSVKKEAMKKEFVDDNIEYYFSRFENRLKSNNGHIGGKLSWADFILVGVIETLSIYTDTEIEKPYATIQALVQKIRNLPGVKEYIAKRPPYTLRF